MENESNAVGGGRVLDLPSGFRFLPSDFQLINGYLKPKVLGHVLSCDFIPTLEVLQFNPWDLPGDCKEKRYFFCTRGKKVNKYKLSSNLGYWKATGKQQVIWNANTKGAIGLKRRLKFCPNMDSIHSHPVSAATTHKWVMWEYRLATSVNATPGSEKNAIEEEGEWMVCAIITEEVKKPINNNGTKPTQPRAINKVEMENAEENDAVTQKNYRKKLFPKDSSTSSRSTMTLTINEDLFSDGEETSASSYLRE